MADHPCLLRCTCLRAFQWGRVPCRPSRSDCVSMAKMSACLLMQGTSNCKLSVPSVAPLCTAKVTTIFCEHFIAIAWGCMSNAHKSVDCSS